MQYFQGVFETAEVQVVERDSARLPAPGSAQAHREPAHQLHRKVRPTLPSLLKRVYLVSNTF